MHKHDKKAYSLLSLFCVLFMGKKGDVCGKRWIFLYTSPYEHVQYI